MKYAYAHGVAGSMNSKETGEYVHRLCGRGRGRSSFGICSSRPLRCRAQGSEKTTELGSSNSWSRTSSCWCCNFTIRAGLVRSIRPLRRLAGIFEVRSHYHFLCGRMNGIFAFPRSLRASNFRGRVPGKSFACRVFFARLCISLFALGRCRRIVQDPLGQSFAGRATSFDKFWKGFGKIGFLQQLFVNTNKTLQ
jgi:hypothetical protein